MTSEPDVSSSRLSDDIAAKIRASILDGEFEAGQRLVERKLAEAYGVSHIPIREALSTLAEEGLVERLPRRGARVVNLTVRDLEEVSSLRTTLEQFAIQRTQRNLTPEREARLREIVAGMFADAKRGDAESLFARDQEFHSVVSEFADHHLLLTVLLQLRNRVSGFLAAAQRDLTPDQQLEHARAHLELLDAIVSRDPDAASRAVTDHIATALSRIEDTERRPLVD